MDILETAGEAWVDVVGAEDARLKVIVPWRRNWCYFPIGSLRLGYLKTSP